MQAGKALYATHSQMLDAPELPRSSRVIFLRPPVSSAFLCFFCGRSDRKASFRFAAIVPDDRAAGSFEGTVPYPNMSFNEIPTFALSASESASERVLAGRPVR